MKVLVALTLSMMFASAVAAITVDTTTEFKDSSTLMKLLQGIEEDTVWIVEFYDITQVDSLDTKLNTEFAKAPYKDDIPNLETDLTYKLLVVDINDPKYGDAMEKLGMHSNQFQATYPVALVMRKRKGFFAWGKTLETSIAERAWEVVKDMIDEEST